MKKNISNNQKIIFLFISILAYTICYIILLEDDTKPTQKEVPIYRPEYSQILIKAKAFTIIDKNTPYQIVTSNKQFKFKNIFILKKISADFGEKHEYLIDIHQDDINKILKKSNLEIYSNTIHFEQKKKRQRRTYEINY